MRKSDTAAIQRNSINRVNNAVCIARSTTDPSAAFGARVRALRRSGKLTQRDLAQQVNCSVITVRKIESGERRPSPEMAGLLAVHLRVPPAEREAFLALAGAQEGGDASQLIGRDAELDRIVDLLVRGGARLLTLAGTGGVGKTSLAGEVQRQAQHHFVDGARLVPLAAINDPAQLVPALCVALGVEPATERALHNALRNRRVLLVLDNFEQITSAASQLGSLSAACPHVQLLVTSRHLLGIKGERVIEVRPLPAPAARQLFMQRAAESSPGTPSTTDDADREAVSTLCSMLDGLPLAIELVAARCKLMRPAQLLQRLVLPDESRPAGARLRVELVADGISNLPERQRTLRDAIDWSYALLAAHEQHALCALAVFEDGWTLEAAEAVLSDGAGDAIRVWNTLSVLIDRSFVLRNPQTGRFGMLQTIREVLLAKLRASGNEDAVSLRHTKHFKEIALAANTEWHPAPDATLAAHVLADQHNLRAALNWALAHPAHLDPAFPICRALAQHWQYQGNGAEARRWIERCLAAGAQRPVASNEANMLMARCDLARVHWRLNEISRAVDIAEPALQDALRLKHKLATIHALRTMGNCAHDGGDFARSIVLNAQALALCVEPGDRFQRCRLLVNSGMAHIHDGNLDQALACFDNAARLAQNTSDHILITVVNLGTGMAHARAGSADAAATALAQALDDIGQNQFLSYLPETLSEAARALSLRNQWTRAAQLLGAASGVSGYLREQMNPMDHKDFAATVQAVRAALPDAQFEAAFVAGGALTHAEAIATAREWLKSL